MKIRKIEESIGVTGKVTNSSNSSTKDTYSCDYLNDHTLAIDTTLDGHDEEVMLIKGKNLFDLNAPKLEGYLDNNALKFVATTNKRYCTYISCKANTTYTISKKSGLRFTVGSSNQILSDESKLLNAINNNTATSITIITHQNAKYLCIWYCDSNEDEVALRNSIQVEENSTATTYEQPQHKEIYVNGEKYTDTISVGTEPNNAGVQFEISENLYDYRNLLTQTKNGITTTNNNDGSFKVNGTASANTEIRLYPGEIKSSDFNGKTIYPNISGNNILLLIAYYDSSLTWKDMTTVTNDGFTINTTYPNIIIYYYIRSGVTVNNEIIKPMIVKGTLQNKNKFEPYVFPSIKVNGETILKGGENKGSSSILGIPVNYCKKGNIATITISGSLSSSMSAYQFYNIQMPDEYKPPFDIIEFGINIDGKVIMYSLTTAGLLRIYAVNETIPSGKFLRYCLTYITND